MTTTTRRKRTLSPEELAAGGTPHVAATAGTAPDGAIGGDQVLSAARNRAETGQTAPTVVPEGYGEVTGTGIETTGDVGATMPGAPTILDGGEGTGGGGTTYSDDAVMPDENGEGGVTGEMAPYQSMDDLFEQYARDSFAEVDTSEEEAQMQAQQDRLLGRGLVDTRARMGEAGFAAGGLDVALENTARAEAAEQLGLHISGIRDREGEQRRQAIEGAMGLDIEKQSSARQDAILKAQMEALAALMDQNGEAPPDGGGEGGGDDLGTSINEGINAIGEGAADLLGRGEGAREQQAQEGALHTPGVPEGANVVEYPEDARENREAQLEASGYSWETVTDDGVTVYRNDKGERLYVRWS